VDGRCLRRVRGLVLRQDEPRAPFWHSFDLALTRFGGKRAPAVPGVDDVTREAYSHEVASFGFWPGDEELRESSYYAYAAPEPAGLRETTLRPEAARWSERRGGSLALLPYEAVRTADEPKAALLAFLESAYAAGADVLCWDRAELESSWCPRPACPARAALAMTAALDGKRDRRPPARGLRTQADRRDGSLRACRATAPVAELAVYLRAPGTVVRCRSCDAVLMVLVTVRGVTCVDLRGFEALGAKEE
jgi:Family of unknown function (DUF5996)/Family of unknown function (DUF6510)